MLNNNKINRNTIYSKIIFKCCESEMYLIVQLPHYKRTYDHIYQIEKYIRALYRKLVLFLQSKIFFATYQRMRANMKSWAGTSHYT